MKETVRIDFDGNVFHGTARSFLDGLGLGPDVAEVSGFELYGKVSRFVHVTLANDDDRLPKLLAELRQRGIEWDEYWRDRYTEEDLESARLLMISPMQMVQISGGAEFGTTYDLSAGCATCGTGSPQTSAMFVCADYDEPARLVGHRMAATDYNDILIDERLAEELDEHATGMKLHTVYALDRETKRQTKLRWRQLRSTRTLPPMAPQTTGRFVYRQCEVCKRDGFSEEPENAPRFAYRAADVADIDDVNESWEWFSFSSLEKKFGYIKLGRPRLLVTPRVMRVIRAAGVTEKEFEFIPIRVTED